MVDSGTQIDLIGREKQKFLCVSLYYEGAIPIMEPAEFLGKTCNIKLSFKAMVWPVDKKSGPPISDYFEKILSENIIFKVWVFCELLVLLMFVQLNTMEINR